MDSCGSFFEKANVQQKKMLASNLNMSQLYCTGMGGVNEIQLPLQQPHNPSREDHSANEHREAISAVLDHG